jgi:hypothetical protein
MAPVMHHEYHEQIESIFEAQRERQIVALGGPRLEAQLLYTNFVISIPELRDQFGHSQVRQGLYMEIIICSF